MLDSATLQHDIVDGRGVLVARRGAVVSPAAIREAARRAPRGPRRLLADSFVAQDLRLPLLGASQEWLLRGPAAEAGTLRALRAVSLPGPLFDELSAVKLADPLRYAHALSTAALTARMLLAAEGAEPPGLPEAVAAGLLHDIGLRQVPVRIRQATGPLDAAEAREVAAHTLLGALYVASLLGEHPAVEVALGHHGWAGEGYPRLEAAASPLVAAVGVASAFSALTAPRPFRSGPYEPRAALDVLVREARESGADLAPLRMLLHALRGGEGSLGAVSFSEARKGGEPEVNRYRGVAAALR
ncbi:HD-GYP domain-containing protein [Anaeromyxobacter paludicola]|uniref:HD/PDEase domain-containing protein n=1 Tax=Anaeromyxobacter paludicola TaxID=2918171 RepID=A0ABM7XES1_9BACT|nr:HD domain-containing phosphohydrolase [Anaeromyxobacter paludicola]BDG10387.1 hypothetical protein AMPC_35000 [Anaeromyxobacter paludicola]